MITAQAPTEMRVLAAIAPSAGRALKAIACRATQLGVFGHGYDGHVSIRTLDQRQAVREAIESNRLTPVWTVGRHGGAIYIQRNELANPSASCELNSLEASL